MRRTANQRQAAADTLAHARDVARYRKHRYRGGVLSLEWEAWGNGCSLPVSEWDPPPVGWWDENRF